MVKVLFRSHLCLYGIIQFLVLPMKIIFAINISAIPNFVLGADSKETCSKSHAVLQNLYIYYVVGVFTVR